MRSRLLTLRRCGLAILTLGVLAALVGVAFAYFTSAGAGTATASVATLSAPAITSTSAGAGTATINWSTITPPGAGTVSYYVTRAGGDPAGNCPTAAHPSSTLTSCTDAGLANGTYTYTVTAVWQSWTATSTSVDVTLASGAASKIVLSQGISGTSFASGATDTLTATIEDAAGNPVTTGPDSTDSITFSQPSGAGSVTGLGSKAATAGVASITITGNQAGAVNLQAAGTINSAATSSNTLNDTVIPGTASQLVFTTQPDGSATANTPFPTQPIVTAKDAAGNTVASYNKTITLAIKGGTGTTGASLTCGTPTVSNGVTTFSGCKIDTAGTNYQLTATDTTTPTPLTATSDPFSVSNLSAASVAQATGPSSPLSTTSITPVNGSAYLVFVYCSGQQASCNGGAAKATVSSPALSSVTLDETVGTGTSKDCLEVFAATGTSTSAAITVTGASGQTIGFVNVVKLSPGATLKNAPNFPTLAGSTSPATATLSSPSSSLGEIVPVAVADGNGQTSISAQTPSSGMNLLGTAQQNGAVGADMSVFFDSTAQATASFTLNPTNPINGWATFAIEVG